MAGKQCYVLCKMQCSPRVSFSRHSIYTMNLRHHKFVYQVLLPLKACKLQHILNDKIVTAKSPLVTQQYLLKYTARPLREQLPVLPLPSSSLDPGMCYGGGINHMSCPASIVYLLSTAHNGEGKRASNSLFSIISHLYYK